MEVILATRWIFESSSSSIHPGCPNRSIVVECKAAKNIKCIPQKSMYTRHVTVENISFMMSSTLSVPVLQWDISQKFLKQPSDNPASPLPVPNSTKSLWLNTPGANPLAKEGSHGPLTTDADICIIGSGITGVSTAYHLAQQLNQVDRPIKAVILEARDFCSLSFFLMLLNP